MQREKGPEANLGHWAGPACFQDGDSLLDDAPEQGTCWVTPLGPFVLPRWLPPWLRWSPWAGVDQHGY